MKDYPNICLINPPAVLSKGRIGSVTKNPPMGIAYIAGYLKEKMQIDLSVLDAFGERPVEPVDIGKYVILGLTNEEIVNRIPDSMDVIGISCMFSNEWFYVKDLIQRIKDRYVNIKIVLGGEHATALPHYIMERCPAVDYIVLGEGEETFSRLVMSLCNKYNVNNIPGIVYRDNGRVVTNNKSGKDRIIDIDRIPYPAWDLVPLENYLREGIGTITSKGKRIMPVLASRGCPYKCKFCSNAIMWYSPYIMRKTDEVIREIKLYKEKYNITSFEFEDLTLIFKKDWILDFCRKLAEARIDLDFNIPATRSESIDREVIDALVKCRCSNICITPDSGSTFQLDDMDKRLDLKKVSRVIKNLLAAGINLKVNLVIGFPSERHIHILQTILYGIKMSLLGVNSLLFYRFVPYPGSEYFSSLQENGKIPKEGRKFDDFLSVNTFNEFARIQSFSHYVSNIAIKIYLIGGYAVCQFLYYIVHPWEIFGTFRRAIKNQAEAQTDLLLINLLQKLGIMTGPETASSFGAGKNHG